MDDSNQDYQTSCCNLNHTLIHSRTRKHCNISKRSSSSHNSGNSDNIITYLCNMNKSSAMNESREIELARRLQQDAGFAHLTQAAGHKHLAPQQQVGSSSFDGLKGSGRLIGRSTRPLQLLQSTPPPPSSVSLAASCRQVSKAKYGGRGARGARSSAILISSTIAISSLLLLAIVLLATVSGAHSSPARGEAHLASRFRRQAAIATNGGSNEVTTTELPAPAAVDSSSPSEPEESDASSSSTTTSTTTTTTTTTTSTTTVAPVVETSAGPAKKAKLAPVNFTLVDELFTAVLDEPEVAAKWRKFDKNLQAGVGAILKMVFPSIVSMASDAKVSGSCSGAILKWILNLKNLRTWAVKMLDSIGKPSAGLLEGSLTLFGNYKQCLQVRAPDEDEIEISDDEFKEYFRGQYCVLQIKPALPKKTPFFNLNSTIDGLLRKSYKYYEKTVYDELSELAMAFNFVSIRADLCVPSLCSRDDIQKVADLLAGKMEMRARVQRCDVEPAEDQSMIDQHHLLWSLVFVILLMLVLVSTLTSMAFKMKNRSSKSKTKSIFTSMSVYRSLRHMKDVQMDRINDSKPVFLYSLRIIILLWIFLVSLTSQLNFQYLRELLSLRSLIMQWPMQFLVNSTLQFDALILLTAFTYAYQNINGNLCDLIKYNVSKYTRLMPSIMLFVAITIITPLLYQSRSPVWHDFVDEPAQVCKTNGLVNVLFVQNFLQSSQICLPQTWIFAVELQLCIVFMPIVYLLNKSFDSQHGAFKLTSAPVLVLILAALAGCVHNFANVYAHSLPAAWFLTYPDKEDKDTYFSLHLYRTWAHLTTFSVGLFTGYLCRCQSIETFSGKPYGRRCCDNLMWATSLLVMGVLIFSTHAWSISGVSHLDTPLLSALYASLAPLFWSISLSLILFQLTVPNGQNQRSALTQLLTSDVNLVRIGRLSFLAYLINPYVNTFVLAVQEQAIFSSLLMIGHTFIGNLVITYALAFIVSALVELPCRRLAKKLLIGSRRHCTNLDIIGRQLNIRAKNQGPSHDSFMAQQKQHPYAAGSAANVAVNPQAIPLK